jgi:hypothetical protein
MDSLMHIIVSVRASHRSSTKNENIASHQYKIQVINFVGSHKICSTASKIKSASFHDHGSKGYKDMAKGF